jgi:hypothetical protein
MTESASQTNQASQETSTIGASGEGVQDPALQKDPSDWVSGDDPMTAAQQSYLDTLAKQAGENCLFNSAKRRPHSTSID